MTIPASIDKRTFTRLTKLNLKYLLGEIHDQQHDLNLEAEYLHEADFNNKYILMDDYKETCDTYHKAVKKAFRDFISDKKKLIKAYDNYRTKQAKKKSTTK